jgi:hypothetical protein
MADTYTNQHSPDMVPTITEKSQQLDPVRATIVPPENRNERQSVSLPANEQP